MKIQPPRRALEFLRWFCREDYLEEIEGDLTELYGKYYLQSPGKAKRKFIWNVIKYFRPEFIKSFKFNYSDPTNMIRHNLIITYRIFLRYKSTFIINLTGLSTGLASVLLICLWVMDELSVDKFHENDKRLFQVLRNAEEFGSVYTYTSNSDLLAPALSAEIPEIEFVVPARIEPHGIVSDGKQGFKAIGQFAGRDFFNVFSYEMIEGDKNNVLNDKYALVIGDKLALKLFGSLNNTVGKTLIWEHERYGSISLIISGVFKKPEKHVSEPFDFVVTNELFLEKTTMDKNWSSNPVLTYLTLKEGVDVDEFSQKIEGFIKTKNKNSNEELFLVPFSNRYLFNIYENGKPAGGRIEHVILFTIIAFFILAIACINFMNLSTARASRRLKEVGIKKAIGALRRTLIFQHMSESMLLACASLIVASLLVVLMLPPFNLITSKHLTLTTDHNIILGAIVITVVTGFISGSYPALYLSKFKPSDVLKGRVGTSLSEVWVRKGLVVFQFSISIMLIVAVMIVYKQMDFVRSKNLGYKKENVITFQKEGKLRENLEAFLLEAKNTRGVMNAACTDGLVTNFMSTSAGHSWEGQPDHHGTIEFSSSQVGYDFFETLGLEMMEGRSFSRDLTNEDSKIIVNEKAVKAMELTDPVGKWISLWGRKLEIIGVVKDFHFESMHDSIEPLLLLCLPDHTNTVLIKIESGTEQETLARLEQLYNRFNPGLHFDFTFLDAEYQALYVSEQRMASLSKYFAAIAVIISCLGLFGMAAFTAERRMKEISIRKILGSSEFGVVFLLSRDFTKMVCTSILIALPLGYLIIKSWLDQFAYRIDLEWWHFISVGLMTLLLAWLTVGVQTIKAARVNPSESLRSE